MPASLTVCLALLTLHGRAFADERACVEAAENAIPLRKQGKLHDALKVLVTCADAACPDDVRANCARKVAEINAAMPTLVLAAKDAAGNDLFAVSATMDGAPLLSSLDGRSVSLDPGEHKFKFEAQGQEPVEKLFVIREGEKERREVVTIGQPPPPIVAPPPTPAPAPAPFWTLRRGIGAGVAGAGLVGVGVGLVFGALASSDKDKQAQDNGTNHAQAVEDYNTASANATASTVLVISGAVLAAGGAVIFFTAPRPMAPSAGNSGVRVMPSLTPKSAGLSLGFEL